MAYNMKSSPAQLGAALRVGSKLVKYGKKMYKKYSGQLYSETTSAGKEGLLMTRKERMHHIKSGRMIKNK